MVCAFLDSFCLLFALLKHPKTVFFGGQKHRFYPPKHHLLHAKSYAFATQNLCFGKINADFSLFYLLFFSRLKK